MDTSCSHGERRALKNMPSLYVLLLVMTLSFLSQPQAIVARISVLPSSRPDSFLRARRPAPVTSIVRRIDVPRCTLTPTSQRYAGVEASSAQDSHNARTCAAELIALFSGAELSTSVDVFRCLDLVSSIRLLVPHRRQIFDELLDDDGLAVPWAKLQDPVGTRRRVRQGSHRVLERMIKWPPRAVLDLSKKAVDSGGDPAAFMAALSPVKHDVPDVEGSAAERCSLTKYPYGLRFLNAELNAYMAALFQSINVLAPAAGLNVSLSRFDLFHGHFFLAYDTGRLGILFHAREYPAFDVKRFPYNLGYCQKGSNVLFDESMDLRNILWLAPLPARTNSTGIVQWLAPGALFILDAHPDGIIFKELVPEYLDIVRTISEYDFGKVVADVNYFNIVKALPEDRIFIC